ncbi:hypothetical protein RclHR1_02300017 [Rhizophagus clarus]|uniref:Uncharacterized protein n=1 Tax=Rhizophagus clarus TaxID=94130 RepID=A0A2Z6RPK4_9GLOM|nr:hypothetical protein RclHR1_02300017 [Rhizophagus clarus]
MSMTRYDHLIGRFTRCRIMFHTVPLSRHLFFGSFIESQQQLSPPPFLFFGESIPKYLMILYIFNSSLRSHLLLCHPFFDQQQSKILCSFSSSLSFFFGESTLQDFLWTLYLLIPIDLSSILYFWKGFRVPIGQYHIYLMIPPFSKAKCCFKNI